MPLFFFHVFDQFDKPDREGTECADAGSARRDALQAAASMLSEAGQRVSDEVPWTMHVTDDRGAMVCDLTFSTADVPRKGFG